MANQDDEVMDFRPEYLSDCYNGTKLDILKYCQYIQRLNDEESNEEESDNDDENNRDNPTTRRKRVRRFKRIPRSKIADDGTLKKFRPMDSLFYEKYLDSPDLESQIFQKEFRNRFRMPYTNFLELASELKQHEMFRQWTKKDCTGDPCSPLELLLLGSLRILGRNDTTDSLYEATNVSRETHRVFFHKFLNYGSTVLYDKYVVMPTTTELLIQNMKDYARLGFHGAVGSMDATHIASDRIFRGDANLHSGWKLDRPSRSYNITVNNKLKILYSTRGFPAKWNDKTIVRMDDFCISIKASNIGKDITFDLYYFDTNQRKIAKQKYHGVYVIVDNGYLSWSCTIPPYKDPIYVDQYAWSKWLESVRKDVERTFGILKIRFRIFRAPCTYHGTETLDQIWLTCCALHNMLIEVDGKDISDIDNDNDENGYDEIDNDNDENGYDENDYDNDDNNNDSGNSNDNSKYGDNNGDNNNVDNSGNGNDDNDDNNNDSGNGNDNNNNDDSNNIDDNYNVDNRYDENDNDNNNNDNSNNHDNNHDNSNNNNNEVDNNEIDPTIHEAIAIPDLDGIANIEKFEQILATDALNYADRTYDPAYPNGCGSAIPVSKLTMECFRNRLVKHYTICKMLDIVRWKEKENT
jgi:DDE superfamily endonuclease